jgi:ribosomal protein S18 acetylase RimI-like enzyme
MHRALKVQPARPEDLAAAFRLLFRHMAAEDRQVRVANAVRLVRRGELDPAGVLVVRGREEILGALVCVPAPGAGGLVWPPQAVPGGERRAVEDLLVQEAARWLQERGAKLAQALLAPEDALLAAPLERNGFAHVTSLWYLRHFLELPPELLLATDRLAYADYGSCDRGVFHQTLLRTYEGTLDCPEVNGVRAIDEIIAGHQAQGKYDPRHWWLAFDRGHPVGVLLLTALPEQGQTWDVSYVGVVPEARSHGVGRELTRKALFEARAAEGRQVTLAVDVRNRPAWNLYLSLGFEPYDRREVYLAVWNR